MPAFERSAIVGVHLSSQALNETAALVSRYKDQFAGLIADIVDRTRVHALPEAVLARFGAVDGLVNNAGIIQPFCRLNDLTT